MLPLCKRLPPTRLAALMPRPRRSRKSPPLPAQTQDYRTLEWEERPNEKWGKLPSFYPCGSNNTDDFYLVQDAPNILIVSSLAGMPATKEAHALFTRAYETILPDRYRGTAAVHFLSAYYRSIVKTA